MQSKNPEPHPLILGEVLWDCFPDGSKVLGGAPYNVAWHLQGFGHKPRFLGAVGRDVEGERIRAAMVAHGMDDRGLISLDKFATGRVDVVNGPDGPLFRFPEKSAWDVVEPSFLPPIPENAPLLYQGSLFLRRPVSRATGLYLAREFAGRRFVDINLRSPWYDEDLVRELLPGTTWLKVNEGELDILAKWWKVSVPDRTERAARLQQIVEVPHLILSLGSEGVQWHDIGGTVHCRAAEANLQVVDTVGAGDALSAVLISGILRNNSIPRMLREAVTFAGRICGIPGAIPPGKHFYQQSAGVCPDSLS